MFRIILAACAALFVTTPNAFAGSIGKTVRLVAITSAREVPKVVGPRTLIPTPNGVVEYCNSLPPYSHPPVCGGFDHAVGEFWQDEVLRHWEWDTLLVSSTAEGETFGPKTPVVLHTDATGAEYKDRCAIGQKNLLVVWKHLPEHVLAVAAAKMSNGDRRGVLIIHTPFFFDLVLDCEEMKIVAFRDFVLAGNRVVAIETKVRGYWGTDIPH